MKLFADLSLARRLETVEARGALDYVSTCAQVIPVIEAEALSTMGGHATFVGADSPLTQAFGLGLEEPVSEFEMEELEAFFFRRDSAVNIEVCPFADLSFLQFLSERNYRIVENSNVLYQELPCRLERNVSEFKVRVPQKQEVDEWARILTLGFLGAELPDPGLWEVARLMFLSSASTPFFVEINKYPIGGGVVGIFDGVANFYAHATLPAFRGRGAQNALIQASLNYAMAQGCELAMGTTMPGTSSQKNFERQGFRIAYTRTKFSRTEKLGIYDAA